MRPTPAPPRPLLPLLAATLLALPTTTPAASNDKACAALAEARAVLVRMLDVQDRQRLKQMRARVHAASANLEGLLNQLSTTEPERVAAFRPTWEAFKKTRELAIIPVLLNGGHDDARILVMGVQAERFEDMKAVLGCQ